MTKLYYDMSFSHIAQAMPTTKKIILIHSLHPDLQGLDKLTLHI